MHSRPYRQADPPHLLATPGDTTGEWIAAGQALQRVLLVAAGAGVEAGYMNQPRQVAALRPGLQAALPPLPVPQIVMRLGHVGGEPGPGGHDVPSTKPCSREHARVT